MELKYLGQGFESESKNAVGNILSELFQNDIYDTFFCMSAFASVSAVRFVKQQLKDSSVYNKTIVVGIDQEGTSKDALQELLELKEDGVNSYVFYQRENVIFHPKIYLFEGNNKYALIVGSSNLTGAGLFNNVESSLFLSCSEGEDACSLINDLKSYFASIFDLSDNNLKEITQELIDILVEAGLAPTKVDYQQRYQKHNSGHKEHLDDTQLFPKRKAARIPNVYKRKLKTDPLVKEYIEEVELTDTTVENNPDYKRLWQSNELTERDLNVPSGTTTNPTGSMLLKKGQMEDIDQRSYFRNVMFANLYWETDAHKPHMERTICKFRIIILGVDYGLYDLKLSHNTRTDTKTYIQKNSMTQVSWGKAKEIICRRELVGKFMSIYTNENNEYVIEIK